jgi:2-dehydropantoate 2-reductase
VVRRGRGNQLILGASRPGAPAWRDAHLAALAEIWNEAGLAATVSPQIRREIWIKLWGNMNMNPISALTGATADKILDDPYTHGLVLRMMEEAAAIGQRLGLETGMTPAERSVITRKLGAFKTSMLQDSEAARPLELEPILGVFPELGRKLQVPTPHCDAVYGLLRQREQTRRAGTQ